MATWNRALPHFQDLQIIRKFMLKNQEALGSLRRSSLFSQIKQLTRRNTAVRKFTSIVNESNHTPLLAI
jgi:hypothetical protein